jgi:hypothetical protein
MACKNLKKIYSHETSWSKRPLIQNIPINTIFASKLKLVGYISKSDIEEKGIRISTFRK